MQGRYLVVEEVSPLIEAAHTTAHHILHRRLADDAVLRQVCGDLQQVQGAPAVAITGPGNGGSTTIQFPRGFSGRAYFSLGAKLKFFLTPDGLVQPAPWAAGDANRDILFDWSEFTYNDAGKYLTKGLSLRLASDRCRLRFRETGGS